MWTTPKRRDLNVKFERNDMKSVCCQNLLKPNTLKMKDNDFSVPWFTFLRQCERGHSKMAAYFVGSHFAHIVVILRSIKLDPSWWKRNCLTLYYAKVPRPRSAVWVYLIMGISFWALWYSWGDLLCLRREVKTASLMQLSRHGSQ